MGRSGQGQKNRVPATAAVRRNQGEAMSADDIVLEFPSRATDPGWRVGTSNDFLKMDAEAFVDPAFAAAVAYDPDATLDELLTVRGGVDLDPVAALNLMNDKPFGATFWGYSLWLNPMVEMHQLVVQEEGEPRPRTIGVFPNAESAAEALDRVNKLAADEGRSDELSFQVNARRIVKTPEETCPGMTDAGAELAATIKAGKTVAIFHDFDVDGLTAGEIMRRALVGHGAKVIVGKARRETGFGLNTQFVKEAHKKGASVLITLDCGSKETAPIKLAQSLGMKVIVVDHHDIDPENPAEHHLNPHLHVPETSWNTGSQLSWKLAQALHMEMGTPDDPEHATQSMWLAGFGCLADFGSVMLPENRAFFWVPAQTPPAGVAALAELLEEDPTQPGGVVLTQATLNLGKRVIHPEVPDLIEKLMTATERTPAVEKAAKRLLEIREECTAAKKAMTKVALEQTGTAVVVEDDTLKGLLKATSVEEAIPHARVLLRGKPVSEATAFAEKLVALDKKARTERVEFVAETIGRDPIDVEKGGTLRPDPDEHWAVAVIGPGFENYPGYARMVGNDVARRTKKPALAFVYEGEDEFGQRTYKLSASPGGGVRQKIGEVTKVEAVRQAFTCKRRDEEGNIVEHPVIGGHEDVFAGSITEDKLEEGIAAIKEWAAEAAKKKGWFPDDRDWPTFVWERQVEPERFARLEQEARLFAPFSRKKVDAIFFPKPADAYEDKDALKRWESERKAKSAANRELEVSVMGRLADNLVPSEESEGWLSGTLILDDGSEREVAIPDYLPIEPGERVEWPLEVGLPGRKYLRSFFRAS